VVFNLPRSRAELRGLIRRKVIGQRESDVFSTRPRPNKGVGILIHYVMIRELSRKIRLIELAPGSIPSSLDGEEPICTPTIARSLRHNERLHGLVRQLV